MTVEVMVTPWPEETPVTERAIRERFKDEDLRPHPWANGPDDVYAPHSHHYDKVLYVVEGTITFRLPESNHEIFMQAGDRLDIPAGVEHEAIVGPEGVRCLEAHG